ncbi:MAG TPA: UDP-N-acetylmuramoyl-L-alanyl-D-glutamate--2,6-diaminopimelate ligase [Candidatus Saccharimonadales bacterium]|nr:UDP-N-acetylmuramoyl-L-alanyl-D-glutamate--2,6-diaminopimelate ligase [Candidatus Saccharimonadales bacterium]
MSIRKIVKLLIPKALFRKIEPAGHLVEAVVMNLIYGFPGRKLKIIGVTGTNGKTTTAFLIHRMLYEAGYSVGLMTTVAYGAGDSLVMPPDHYTNVPAPLMMKRLRQLRKQGVDWLVMEVTSQALAQNRVWGLPIYLAAMTNISQDHLDYHQTMQKYLAAKVKLFRLAAKNKKGLRTGVVNADDAEAAAFLAAVDNPVTYGVYRGDIRASDIKLSAAGASFKVSAGEDTYHLKTHLPGKFNIYNALTALAVGRALGLSQPEIESGIAAQKGVPGRMTAIRTAQKFHVLVDFAHSPDALLNALTACRELTKGRLILVFGATGDRDTSKRPLMGQVAARHADLIFLTDDETYTEDPKQILDAVYQGIGEAGGAQKTKVIGDRRKAIREAFKAAQPGDTVLLTGIGHQTSRNMGGKEEPWNEIEIAKKILKSLRRASSKTS